MADDFSEDLPRCECRQVERRKRVQSNGVQIVVRQCLRCGANKGSVPKSSVRIWELAEWDESLREAWQAKWQAHWKRRAEWYERSRQETQAEWREAYNDHLTSPKWQRLRGRVFDRAGGLCEGCRQNRATQVHHLTYERMGDEMLFDLVAICEPCHSRLHGRPVGHLGIQIVGGRTH